MSDTLTLPAETRERAGKGASRALRREGRVPAVVYGGNEEPRWRSMSRKRNCVKQLGTGHFFNSIVEVEVGGKTVRTLPKDVAFHPVSDRPLHADFLRLSKDAKVHVKCRCTSQRRSLAGPEARRRAQHRASRAGTDLRRGQDPRRIVDRRDRLRCGRFDPHQPREAAQGSKSAITDRDFTIATVVAPSGCVSEEGDTTKSEGEANK
jgi:large subunit ribosomal protein L25